MREERMFYMVYGGGVRTGPVIKHPSYTEANAEACRLAKVNPGQAFYILQATNKVVVEAQPVVCIALM